MLQPNGEGPSEQRMDLGRTAATSLAWSILQNWGKRGSTFVIFIVLSRFLTPTEFGMVAAATIILMMIGLLAEFGFGDAIVQRPGYQPADANLPFLLSVIGAVVIATVCAINAPTIARWMNAEGTEAIIVALCAIAPFNTISLFQEANYRRGFAYRQLAFRVFIANTLAGLLAIAGAVAGLGVWSLVAQTYLATFVGLWWLWRKPVWIPTRELRPRALREMTRFGLPMVSIRMIDFFAGRYFEIVLLGRYGIAAFGLYAVGSRLYNMMMQLLQSALGDVSLSVLSRVSDDRGRMGRIYLLTQSAAAYVVAPIFVCTAALMPEIAPVVFGEQWTGIEEIGRAMLLLGAVQSVQFLNGPYLSSRGRTGLVFSASLLRNLSVVACVLAIPTTAMAELVWLFVAAQLIVAPFPYWLVLRELRIPSLDLLRALAPAIVAGTAAFFAVEFARPELAPTLQIPALLGLLLGGIFSATFAAVLLGLAYRRVLEVFQYFKGRFKK